MNSEEGADLALGHTDHPETVREYAQQIYREVYRDSWLDDGQSVRLQCLSLAVQGNPIFRKDEDATEGTITAAEAFYRYVMEGRDEPAKREEVSA